MALAQKLLALGWGRDTTPVVAKGPPKSIQVRRWWRVVVVRAAPQLWHRHRLPLIVQNAR
jgi:hypothetical protein